MTKVPSSSSAALDDPAQLRYPSPGAGTATTGAALPGNGKPREGSCGAALEARSVVNRNSSRAGNTPRESYGEPIIDGQRRIVMGAEAPPRKEAVAARM